MASARGFTLKKHVPLIRFPPRRGGAGSHAKSYQVSSAKVTSVPTVRDVPRTFTRFAMSQEEIELVQLGGAYDPPLPKGNKKPPSE